MAPRKHQPTQNRRTADFNVVMSNTVGEMGGTTGRECPCRPPTTTEVRTREHGPQLPLQRTALHPGQRHPSSYSSGQGLRRLWIGEGDAQGSGRTRLWTHMLTETLGRHSQRKGGVSCAARGVWPVVQAPQARAPCHRARCQEHTHNLTCAAGAGLRAPEAQRLQQLRAQARAG